MSKGSIEQIIRERLEQWWTCYNKGDIQSVVQLFTEDVVFMPAGQPTIQGRANVHAHLTKVFESGSVGRLEGSITEIVPISEDAAYSSSTGTLYGKDGTAKAKFRSAVFWKKVDNDWLKYRDIYNAMP